MYLLSTKSVLATIIFVLYAYFLTAQVSFGDAEKINDNWKFQKGDHPAAANLVFDDSNWRNLHLPHDWSVEGPYSPDLASCTGYLPGGIAWYRKSFDIPTHKEEKKLYIYFEGVYRDGEVFINGYAQRLGMKNLPGAIIAHSPASTGIFLGTPSIAMTPDGTYFASHDHFGDKKDIIYIYRSDHKGLSWQKISEVSGFWSGLFWHNDTLYLMGTSSQYGHLIIHRSDDKGLTWTEPIDQNTGLIRQHTPDKGYHTSAVSLVTNNGRIYRPIEIARRDGGWGKFEAMVFSAPENANLLKAQSWITTTSMAVDTAWGTEYRTWLEGGAVISPEGKVLNILRVDNRDEEMAAIMHVSDDAKTVSFNPERDFISFPGGCKRFVIRYDDLSNRYWSLSNWIPEEFEGHNVERTRNTLALISSPDLRNWTVHRVILQDDNIDKSGFQYVDWLVDGSDMIFVSRTSFFDGEEYADNQHNSNFITFHRIANFRNHLNENIITLINP